VNILLHSFGSRGIQVIKRAVSRNSTSISDGTSATNKEVVKENFYEDSKELAKEGGRESGKEGGKEGGKESGKEAAKAGGWMDVGGDSQASGKKRERGIAGGGGAGQAKSEYDDAAVRPGKCGRASPTDQTKSHKKSASLDGVKLPRGSLESASSIGGVGYKGQQETVTSPKTGNSVALARTHESIASSALSKPPAAAAVAHIGESRKESKDGKDGRSERGSHAGKEVVREALREWAAEIKGGQSGQAAAKSKGMIKDVHDKGGEGATAAAARVAEGATGDMKGKAKNGSKRRSLEDARSVEDAESRAESRTGGGGATAEDEDSDSGGDEVNGASRSRKRKIVVKKVTLGDKKDAPVVPATKGVGGVGGVAMDTESTDSNGISGGGRPASAGGNGGVIVAEMSCKESGDASSAALVSSPSCHAFSAGQGSTSSRQLSARRSKWKIVTFGGFGEDGAAVGSGAATRVRSGQFVCIAFDLRDGEGKGVHDDRQLRESFELITFRGCSPDSGDSVWQRGLEQRVKLNRFGDLVCGEVRVMCRTGKFTLKASVRHRDGEPEDFVHECALEVVAGAPSLHRSALSLHLVSEGKALGSRARNGKHSARAATAPLLMGATSNVGQDVHVEMSVETMCDDAGNVLASSPSAIQELSVLLRVTHIYPLMWGEAQDTFAVAHDTADADLSERRSSGEGRLSIEADTESVDVVASVVSAGAGVGTGAGVVFQRVRLFTVCPQGAGNHVLLFRGVGPAVDTDQEGTLLFHIDILTSKKI